MPDWSQLPEELLFIISTYLEENCFDVVHARSGCTSWRSSFPFPSSLLRTSYSLPSFAKFPRKSKGFCTSRRSLCSSLGEFVLLLNQRLLALTSAEMRWKLVMNVPNARCSEGLAFNRFKCRVSRLDEEAGKWVVVTDLGDRVLFIGHFGNVSCSAKELPIGCGVSGNSVLSTFRPGNVTYVYKYGVHTGNEEDDRYRWRCQMKVAFDTA
ncbi:hypothetical protein ISN45_Aa04g007050 [Arabidopsis thaliana x Arabidopsis arenosa]|uniref:KIB1-4 beta-propeller domain-containing protein n=1 Tax=Arabidopsis thaliana x Arabidopsis arenosa TaxID=1240361 RepID=A0A8T2A631_9BRAS|nr:hypothetical protein ISN45_Aa04g007050 [Arabidopsis thaliana x Arabidopsis arenosa]